MSEMVSDNKLQCRHIYFYNVIKNIRHTSQYKRFALQKNVKENMLQSLRRVLNTVTVGYNTFKHKKKKMKTRR